MNIAMGMVGVLGFVAILGQPALGEDWSHVNLNKLVDETQQQTEDPDRLTMVWWLPVEYWHVAFSQDPSMTDQDVQEMIDVLQPYILIAVVDGRLGPLGGANFESEEFVRASTRVLDTKERALLPLADTDVSADARNFASMIGPMMANMLGPMGESMYFLFFQRADDDGQLLPGAMNEGRFTVKVGSEMFSWRLPLGSLLVPKLCPVDGERLSGAWAYCPWHGKKLEEASD